VRCVVDTNVLVSALLLPDSVPRQAFDLALERGTILLSLAALAELSTVLSRPRLRRYLSEATIRRFLRALVRQSEWIEVVEAVAGSRDPRDNKFLALAVSGRATHIVTGDMDLQSLHPFRGISIIGPQSFLAENSES